MTGNLRRDIIQWDVSSWSGILNYWDGKTDWSKVQNALELGGRQGGLSLWLALKGIQTTCSDIKHVRENAEELHLRYKVASLVKYEEINAVNIPYENHFDIIIFKSIMGVIGIYDNYENQQKAFTEIHKALKPGGMLLFAENLAASSFHQFLRKRLVRWGSAWRYLSLAEMKDCLKVFSSCEVKTTGVLATFGRNEGQRRVLSAADKLILNHVCPEHWKYIAYGMAVK